ncbi:hypothetical protein CGLAUT_00430 [Corynebacterium glaucum]|uniref:alpha/beta hydrolase n=1 Tax=Corynebacterium glaucum TaxID=187491 RepID=UPI0025B2FC7E|nr:alpha/beta hydrolase [Corynebacterium glaucum]WJZ06608.1 hypothetical protein CGLAUT_00430 [Corynebacterium glaucum]
MVEPINEQLSDDFHVGGRDREMPPELQLEQLVSYIEATYDPSSEQYLALLPDRITHAAMLMLGSGIDQSMPGVAFPGGVEVRQVELGTLFVPSSPTATWGISLYDGPSNAKNNSWRPEVAGVAELSGATMLDVNNLADAEAAVEFARAEGAKRIAVWAFGAAAESIPPDADVHVLTFPTVVPDSSTKAVSFLQVALKDEVVARVQPPRRAQVVAYHSTHYIATPAESRRRVRDVAEFLASA